MVTGIRRRDFLAGAWTLGWGAVMLERLTTLPQAAGGPAARGSGALAVLPANPYYFQDARQAGRSGR